MRQQITRMSFVGFMLLFAFSVMGRSVCRETCAGGSGKLVCRGDTVAVCGCTSGGAFSGVCESANVRDMAPQKFRRPDAGPSIDDTVRMTTDPQCELVLEIDPDQRAKILRLLKTLDKQVLRFRGVVVSGRDAAPIAKAYRDIVSTVDAKNTIAYANAFNALADAMAKASPRTKALVAEVLRPTPAVTPTINESTPQN